MRRFNLFHLSILGLCIVGILAIIMLSTSHTSYAQQHIPDTTAISTPTNSANSNAFGLPAITPHAQKPNVSEAKTSATTATTPAFTIDDVIQYVNMHPVPEALVTGSKPSIVKAAFLSSQEISKLLKGEDMGVPDGTLLCYVELHGTFTFYGPRKSSVTYHTAVEVFDVHTGNLLIAGGQ